MKWVDEIWGTVTEQELKKLYNVMKILGKKEICTEIKNALDKKIFWVREKNNLQIMREKKGMTVNELANLTRIPSSIIDKYESGQSNLYNAKFCTVIVLALALNCDVWEIVEMQKIQKKKINSSLAV